MTDTGSARREVKATRKSRPKVKTGCNNCKTRRVKCDETRPQCTKCVRSGRHCDGYPAYKRVDAPPIAIAPKDVSATSRAPSSKSASSSSTSSSSPPTTIISKRVPRIIHRPRPPTPTPTPTPKPKTHLSPTLYKPGTMAFDGQEGQYFQVFRTHTASELSGFFDSEFWTRSVLQESHSEASIRHAVVALGALYKTLEKALESPPGSPDGRYTGDTAPNHYNFALQQYGKAITRLRESLESKESRSQRTVLISIVLFTCFQSFTGDHKAAIFQIQSGLALLEERRQNSKQPLVRRRDDVVEDELIQMFTRLAIQAKSYDMAFHFPPPYVIQLTPKYNTNSNDPTSPQSPSSPSAASSESTKDPHIPDQFANSQEARSALDSLCERIMRFNEALSSFYAGPNNILPSSICSSGQGFRTQLQQWATAFEPLLQSRRTPGISNTERAGIDVLKMIQIMTTVLFLMGFSTSEKEFDNFYLPFKDIVELAKEVVVDEELSLAQSRCGDVSQCRHRHEATNLGLGMPLPGLASDGLNTHLPEHAYLHIKASFALDLGIVPPLFVVATKCRDRKLRREAIRLLMSSPRREGMWDSILCGKAGAWIMEVEEERLAPFDSFNPMSFTQVVAEDQRVMVKEILFDLQKREATLRCGTRGSRERDIDARAKEMYVSW